MLSYIEVSKSRLIHNYLLFRKHIPRQTKIMCVLKGNAYGRGISEVTQILDPIGEYFAVDDIEELRTVRKFTKKPVFVMGYIMDSELEEAIKLNAELSIHSIDRLKQVFKISRRIGKKPKLHIEIDAQFGRMGIRLEELKRFLLYAINIKRNVDVYAAYAHFSCITTRKNNVHDEVQFKLFNKAVDMIKRFGFTNIKKHISSTSGALVYEIKDMDFIRLGAGLYGMWTSEEIKEIAHFKNIKPVIRWVTHVTQIRHLPSSYPVGYGATYITSGKKKIAILPQGYGDGYDCKLSNRGIVLIRGKKCRILGRVSMNMITVDVTGIDGLHVEDEAVLLGWQNNKEITTDEIGAIIGTIHAEVTTRISSALPRLIIE